MLQALPSNQANLNLRLVQPAAVHWCIVSSKSVPDFFPTLHAKALLQRSLPMSIYIIHDEMNGPRVLVLLREPRKELCKITSFSIRMKTGEMTAGFGLYGAKNICCSFAYIRKRLLQDVFPIV